MNKFLVSFIAGLALSSGLLAGGNKDALLFVMPLKDNLETVSEGGASKNNAKFIRSGTATGQDFSIVKDNVPRFYKVNGGKGLLMENGSNSWKHLERGTNNNFSELIAACDKPDALQLYNGAGVKVVKGIQNGRALEVLPKSSGSKVASATGDVKTGEPYIASFYASGPANIKVSITLIRKDGSRQACPAKSFSLSKAWERCFVDFKDAATNVGKYKKAKNPTVKAELDFVSEDGKPFSVDAMMLEQCGLYMSRVTPSSWIPGNRWRGSETLLVPMPETVLPSGTITLKYIPTSKGNWNTLICSGSGWKPVLRIDCRRNLSLIGIKAFGCDFASKYKMKIGKPVYIAVSWNKDSVILYADGKKLGEGSPKKISSLARNLSVGGTPDAKSPNNKADGIISEVTVWRRALNQAEIEELGRDKAFADLGISSDLTLLTPCKVFARDMDKAQMIWACKKPDITKAEISVSGFFTNQVKPEQGRLVYSFAPSGLMPGKYQVKVELEGKVLNFPIEIAPARVKWENFQVCSWNASGDFAPKGVTIGGLWSATPVEVDLNTSRGLYSEENIFFKGNPRSRNNKSDWGADRHGKLIYPDVLSPVVRQSFVDTGERLAQELRQMPDVKAVILNTEQHTGSARISFSPRAMRIAKEKFGLDLALWKNSTLRDWKVLNPQGRLSIKVAPKLIPACRVVPLDNPFYAFHRWWHSESGATEVVTNEILAEKLLAARPDLLVMREPILRRPAVISYAKINVAQDWLYYSDPKNVIYSNENLGRVARDYPKMVASTMPQFLLKPGMAAPFAGMPTADMFREACFLVASRPARVTTFWNFPAILVKKRNYMTPDEIEKQLGGALKWNETKKVIKQKKLNIYAWDPELAGAFSEMSRKLWLPMGALMPNWRNVPRRIAVVNSFASVLFGDERWPGIPPMYRQLVNSGIPFDILVDQDFEYPLKQKYDVIMFPDCHAMTKPAYSALCKFIADGGTVLVDDKCKVDLPGAVKLTMKTKTTDGNIQEKEAALLKKYHGRTEHPQYIEAMESLVQQKMSAGENPRLTKILKSKLKMAVECKTKAVCWNLLKAGGSQYLFVVNDLRVPGPFYGRYGKVRENGVAQTVEFEYKGGCKYAYDLLSSKPVDIDKGSLKINLKPSGAAIVLFTNSPVNGLKAAMSDGVSRGSKLMVDIRISGIKKGLIPVKLDLIRPDGKNSSLSCYDVAANGKLTWNIPIAFNAPGGKWQIKVKELASGAANELAFTLK